MTRRPLLAAGSRVLIVLVSTALLYLGSMVYNQKLDVTRFQADSISRDADHALLLRIDTRVSAMYCETVPVQQQPACN